MPTAHVTIWTPATIRELIRNETRVAKGNQQLAAFLKDEQSMSGVDTAPATHVRRYPLAKLRTLRQWSRDLRLPDCVPLTVYLSVTSVTRLYLAFLRIRERQISLR